MGFEIIALYFILCLQLLNTTILVVVVFYLWKNFAAILDLILDVKKCVDDLYTKQIWSIESACANGKPLNRSIMDCLTQMIDYNVDTESARKLKTVLNCLPLHK